MLLTQDMVALFIVVIATTLLLKKTFFSFRGMKNGSCSSCNGCMMKTITGNCERSTSNISVENFQV